MSIKVYSAGPSCQQCTAVKRWMTKRGIQFEEVPASDYVDMLQELGYSQAPVVIVDDTIHFYGFDPDRLERYCNRKSWP